MVQARDRVAMWMSGTGDAWRRCGRTMGAWTRRCGQECVSVGQNASGRVNEGRGAGCDCERRGMTVTPLWPPTTGTETFSAKDRSPRISDTNVEAHTTSRVVMLKSLLGSNTPCFLNTSATIGTVELTGFETTSMKAPGTVAAMLVASSLDHAQCRH